MRSLYTEEDKQMDNMLDVYISYINSLYRAGECTDIPGIKNLKTKSAYEMFENMARNGIRFTNVK